MKAEQMGKTEEVIPDEFDDEDACQHCGGEGFIMESDGDPSDWGEDTYCGPEDSVIMCRHCKGKGYLP